MRQVQLALVLAEAGAPFVVVGGTARLLRGRPHVPHDLDVVVTRSDAEAFAAIVASFVSSSASLRPAGASPQRLLTSWTPLAVFLEDEHPSWRPLLLDGARLRVSA